MYVSDIKDLMTSLSAKDGAQEKLYDHDKEEQLAKIRKPLKPCANISVQVFAQERGLHANYSVYTE